MYIYLGAGFWAPKVEKGKKKNEHLNLTKLSTNLTHHGLYDYIIWVLPFLFWFQCLVMTAVMELGYTCKESRGAPGTQSAFSFIHNYF